MRKEGYVLAELMIAMMILLCIIDGLIIYKPEEVNDVLRLAEESLAYFNEHQDESLLVKDGYVISFQKIKEDCYEFTIWKNEQKCYQTQVYY